jgi:hypothetical protein
MSHAEFLFQQKQLELLLTHDQPDSLSQHPCTVSQTMIQNMSKKRKREPSVTEAKKAARVERITVTTANKCQSSPLPLWRTHTSRLGPIRVNIPKTASGKSYDIRIQFKSFEKGSRFKECRTAEDPLYVRVSCKNTALKFISYADCLKVDCPLVDRDSEIRFDVVARQKIKDVQNDSKGVYKIQVLSDEGRVIEAESMFYRIPRGKNEYYVKKLEDKLKDILSSGVDLLNKETFEQRRTRIMRELEEDQSNENVSNTQYAIIEQIASSNSSHEPYHVINELVKVTHNYPGHQQVFTNETSVNLQHELQDPYILDTDHIFSMDQDNYIDLPINPEDWLYPGFGVMCIE